MAVEKASAKRKYKRPPTKRAKRTVAKKRTVTSKSTKVGVTEFPSKEQAGRFKRRKASTMKNKRKVAQYSDTAAANIPKSSQGRVIQLRKNKSSEKKAKFQTKFENSSGKQRRAGFLRMQTEGKLFKKSSTGKRTVKTRTERPPSKIKAGGIGW